MLSIRVLLHRLNIEQREIRQDVRKQRSLDMPPLETWPTSNLWQDVVPIPPVMNEWRVSPKTEAGDGGWKVITYRRINDMQKKYDDGGSVDIPPAPPPGAISNPGVPFGPTGNVGSGESKEPIPDWIKAEEKRQGLENGGSVKKPAWRRW
jgi:hypothetical protein